MNKLLTATLIILTLCQTVYALEANFISEVEVEGNTILLRDIATFDKISPLTESLGSQEIGASPALGGSLTLEPQMILRMLAQKKMLPSKIRWQGANKIVVKRKTIEITPAKINEIVNDYLRREGKKRGIRFLFTANSLPAPFKLRSGTINWQVIPSRKGIIGSSRFSLIFRVNNKVQKNFSLRGKLKAYATVAVTTSAIRRNGALTADVVTMQESEISSITDPAYNLKQLQGKKSKRRLKKGAIIRLGQLQQIPVIHRGDRVKIYLVLNGLQLTTLGIARGDGGINDYIRVQNISSNKTVYSQVVAPGTVEVTIQ